MKCLEIGNYFNLQAPFLQSSRFSSDLKRVPFQQTCPPPQYDGPRSHSKGVYASFTRRSRGSGGGHRRNCETTRVDGIDGAGRLQLETRGGSTTETREPK